MARNIHNIALRAAALYPIGTEGAEGGIGKYLLYVEEAWREFVHDCGGIYRETLETPLVIEQREFALPDDYKQLIEARIGYTPRSISSISRTGGTVTVETALAHALAEDMSVRIADVTPVGDTTFDGDFTVASVAAAVPPATESVTFTYADDQDDDTGSGGEVQAAGSSVVLSVAKRSTAAPLPEHEATAGTPASLYFPDSFTLALEPVSDGGYPALLIEYDAEAPEDLDINDTDGLPAPAWVEKGLIGYAAARAGAFPDGLKDYQETLRRWRAARSRREGANVRS